MTPFTRRGTFLTLALGFLMALMPEVMAQQKNRARQGKAANRPTDKSSRFVSAIPAGKWIGQDSHDLVGPMTAIAPSDVQDIHIALAGLPPKSAIKFAKISGLGGGEWQYKGPHGPWGAQIEREEGSTQADLYFEPGQIETGRPFEVLLQFDDGRKAEFALHGGRADPNLRMAGAAMTAEWVGQERVDRVGSGASVGPDGTYDARIRLSRLSRAVEITGVVVAGPGGSEWHSGVNPDGHASAEMIRHGDDPTKADLFLGLDRDLKGQKLSVTVHYTNGKKDAAQLIAGRFDPKNKAPKATPPTVTPIRIGSRWLGQDGTDQVGPGDVHVSLDGLPRLPIVAAALSDDSRGLWSMKVSDKLPFDPGPSPTPMDLRRGEDPAQADLHFPPFRDETGGAMVLRLLFEDGRTAIAQFPGGPANPGLRASSWPEKTVFTAKPGDDLNALANRVGTIRLTKGRYLLRAPLILNRPVRIVGEEGATVVFSQAPGDPTWSAAIKIHSGHTTLESFAVRFDSTIRWTPDLEGGPAVIGVTDNKDPGPGDLKADLTFRKLDLEGPAPKATWEEAPRLMRLGRAVCGLIEGNTLKGGSVELQGGPWRIQKNSYLGTMPGTFCFGAFSVHSPHDLVLKDNKAETTGPVGKTWRFLVLTEAGADDLIEGNTISGIGPRDNDTVQGDNAPEIILSESYSLHFEGKPAGISPDRRVLVVPMLQGEPARTGDVVSILSGPGAGQWRRIVQAMGPTTYLVDAPLPAGEPVISIATGFVRETFRKNTIDSRGSSVAANLVLVGNHYGLKVSNNHFLGGGSFVITAAPTEHPMHWGWSHAPLMGATIEGNILEDAVQGARISVEHSPSIKTSRGRVYASVALRNNTVRWSEEFAAKLSTKGGKAPVAIVIGDQGSFDPAELDVSEESNRREGRHPISMRVQSAKLNGKETRDRMIALPESPASTAGGVSGTSRR